LATNLRSLCAARSTSSELSAFSPCQLPLPPCVRRRVDLRRGTG